ncbi:DUF3152 domain-containing protein [Corynebacterium sp.]|uniref:DUF3152 domain-containing protein n=1 Tax=Corynebacterium sp. TaxID=1720 RepID=UPI003B3ACCB4
MPRSTQPDGTVPSGRPRASRPSQSSAAERFRRRQLRRRRWLGAGGAMVFLLTVAVVTELVVVGGAGLDDTTDSAGSAGSTESTDTVVSRDAGRHGDEGPVPGEPGDPRGVGELPSGGTVTERGEGEFHGVGSAGMTAGDPDRRDADTYSFVVEVENGLDTSSFGGGDAFAASVDATLSDPRSWTSGGTFAFRHISVTARSTPDLRIRLTSPETTRDICGAQIELETSCFIRGPDVEGERHGAATAGRVIVNAARWVRGATTFEGDLGSYRQYLVNHEVGHGLGFARHQVCPDDGVLAPVMMQQTLSLNNGELEDLEAGAEYGDSEPDATCRPNSWPYPHGRSEGDPVDVRE